MRAPEAPGMVDLTKHQKRMFGLLHYPHKLVCDRGQLFIYGREHADRGRRSYRPKGSLHSVEILVASFGLH
jgi:hypothetical protein